MSKATMTDEQETLMAEVCGLLADMRRALEEEDSIALNDGRLQGMVEFNIEVPEGLGRNLDPARLIDALRIAEQNFRPQIGYECGICGELRLLKGKS